MEDLEPNLDYELDKWDQRHGRRVTMNREARAQFLRFGKSAGARWTGNFRDLNAAMVRMATLAPGGRIDVPTVDDEITRLERSWQSHAVQSEDTLLTTFLEEDGMAQLDRFDRSQLCDVIRVCRESRSLSDAGRTLFAVSRTKKAKPNDADRLRKYLARFGLDWQTVSQ